MPFHLQFYSLYVVRVRHALQLTSLISYSYLYRGSECSTTVLHVCPSHHTHVTRMSSLYFSNYSLVVGACKSCSGMRQSKNSACGSSLFIQDKYFFKGPPTRTNRRYPQILFVFLQTNRTMTYPIDPSVDYARPRFLRGCDY